MEDIKELRARIAAKKAEREERLAAPDPEAERSKLIAELAAAEALEAAETEHGKLGEGLCTVEHDGLMVAIFKKPSRGEYKRFTDSKANSEDTLKIVTRCRVYPDHRAFDALLDRWPGLLDEIGLRLAGLAGNKNATEALRGK